MTRRELQVVAKHILHLERMHTTAIRELVQVVCAIHEAGLNDVVDKALANHLEKNPPGSSDSEIAKEHSKERFSQMMAEMGYLQLLPPAKPSGNKNR